VSDRSPHRGGRLLLPLDWLSAWLFAKTVGYWRWRTRHAGWLSARGAAEAWSETENKFSS
jgi:hypothetical protein